MPASIGVNLRVTGHCKQGGRKYMEDYFSVAYQQTEDEKDLEYAFIGIYDGHGGPEAATFAKEQLMESIVRQKNFWSHKDEDVLRAIKDGYIATHYAMWKEQDKWPKTPSGLPSTAGTTASVAFIRMGKIYIGHVGDSGIVLGYQEPGEIMWRARPLTKDHKPENAVEMSRIEQSGGKVVSKSGVPRVVWNRPRLGHRGPVRRSTPIDEIPFLAVARSLGDLWSYNSALDEFVVSPDPDTMVVPIDTSSFRCLIFGTDGLWNMLSPPMAVKIVQTAEKHNEHVILCEQLGAVWLNPSKSLVEQSLERWSTTRLRADNTSAVTLMLDPPGPPREHVLKCYRRTSQTEPVPENGLKIVTRYEDEGKQLQVQHSGYAPTTMTTTTTTSSSSTTATTTTTNSESIQINEVSSSDEFICSRTSRTSEKRPPGGQSDEENDVGGGGAPAGPEPSRKRGRQRPSLPPTLPERNLRERNVIPSPPEAARMRLRHSTIGATTAVTAAAAKPLPKKRPPQNGAATTKRFNTTRRSKRK